MEPTLPGRQVALTLDDLPTISMTEGDFESRRVTTTMLLETLSVHGIPVVGFVIEGVLEARGEPDARQIALLRQWLDAGHELGNHTFSHPDLHRVSAVAFLEDVLRGERVLRPLLAERGAVPRFFRHPYLHTGRSLQIRDAVARFLHGHGYRLAPATVVAEDFWFAAAHDWAVRSRNADRQARVVRSYLLHLERTIAHSETMSLRLLGREIPQVLLLHANRLNALLLPEIVGMLRARGYAFVTLEQALRDPAYASPDRYIGSVGVGWLERWALGRGLDPAAMAPTVTVPAWVRRRAGTPIRVRLHQWAAQPRELLYAHVKKPLREWWRAMR